MPLQPHSYQALLQKHMYELLQERYYNNANIVARIGHYLVTEQDLKEFSNLLGDIYEKAYAKALEDYRVQLESAGVKVAVSYGYKSRQ